jgi:hypothetical protein
MDAAVEWVKLVAEGPLSQPGCFRSGGRRHRHPKVFFSLEALEMTTAKLSNSVLHDALGRVLDATVVWACCIGVLHLYNYYT